MQDRNVGAAAENASKIGDWIQKMQMYLGQGQVELVVEGIEEWKTHLDLEGIPEEIVEATERSFGIARNALQHPMAVDAAIGALNQASQRFVRGSGDV